MGKYKYSEDQTFVTDTETGACIPTSEGCGGWLGEAYREWLAAGNTPDPYTEPTVTTEQRNESIRLGIGIWLDTVAQQNRYDSVLSCISYKDDPITQYAVDAEAMIAFRSAVWAAAFTLLGNPPDGVDTLEEVIALMPDPTTYGWVVHSLSEGTATPETGDDLEASL